MHQEICVNSYDISLSLSLSPLSLTPSLSLSLSLSRMFMFEDAQARQQRELAEAKEKEIAMDQLKTDIKALDLLLKLSIELFVKQVYQSWPPKGTKETQPSLSSSTSSSSQKKLLIQAISHYHPDKVDKNVHGIKWQLLSCEITKCLSMRLAKIK